MSYILKAYNVDINPQMNQDFRGVISPTTNEQVPEPIVRLYPQLDSISSLRMAAADP